MTRDDIEKGRALAEAATDGEWEVTDRGSVNAPARTVSEFSHAFDAAFIAHVRTAYPAALDRIEAVEAENKRLRALAVTLAKACENAVDETAWCPACENHNHTDDCPVPGALR